MRSVLAIVLLSQLIPGQLGQAWAGAGELSEKCNIYLGRLESASESDLLAPEALQALVVEALMMKYPVLMSDRFASLLAPSLSTFKLDDGGVTLENLDSPAYAVALNKVAEDTWKALLQDFRTTADGTPGRDLDYARHYSFSNEVFLEARELIKKIDQTPRLRREAILLLIKLIPIAAKASHRTIEISELREEIRYNWVDKWIMWESNDGPKYDKRNKRHEKGGGYTTVLSTFIWPAVWGGIGWFRLAHGDPSAMFAFTMMPAFHFLHYFKSVYRKIVILKWKQASYHVDKTVAWLRGRSVGLRGKDKLLNISDAEWSTVVPPSIAATAAELASFPNRLGAYTPLLKGGKAADFWSFDEVFREELVRLSPISVAIKEEFETKTEWKRFLTDVEKYQSAVKSGAKQAGATDRILKSIQERKSQVEKYLVFVTEQKRYFDEGLKSIEVGISYLQGEGADQVRKTAVDASMDREMALVNFEENRDATRERLLENQTVYARAKVALMAEVADTKEFFGLLTKSEVSLNPYYTEEGVQEPFAPLIAKVKSRFLK